MHRVAPVYPEGAFVNKVQGTVVVRILIDVEGRVKSAQVIQSVPLLDEAALEAVRQWRFVAARRGRHPVESYATAPVKFSIY